ncbi:MAG: hypothetical protein AB7O56_11645 [Bauldia sp.]
MPDITIKLVKALVDQTLAGEAFRKSVTEKANAGDTLDVFQQQIRAALEANATIWETDDGSEFPPLEKNAKLEALKVVLSGVAPNVWNGPLLDIWKVTANLTGGPIAC